MVRCKHEIVSDILETLIELDKGEGIVPSRLLVGRTRGCLNSVRLSSWLRRMEAVGFIKVNPGVGNSRRVKILLKGRKWQSRFNQLEREMIGERR